MKHSLIRSKSLKQHFEPEFRKLKLHQFHFAKIKLAQGKRLRETRGHFKWLHLTDQTLRTSVKRLDIDGLIIVARSSLFWLHYLETIDLAKTESSTRSDSGRLSNAFDFVRLCVCQWAEKKGAKNLSRKNFFGHFVAILCLVTRPRRRYLKYVYSSVPMYKWAAVTTTTKPPKL